MADTNQVLVDAIKELEKFGRLSADTHKALNNVVKPVDKNLKEVSK